MLHRSLALAALLSASAALSAQSAASFEMEALDSWSVAGNSVIVRGDFHNAGKLDVVYVGNGNNQEDLTMLTGNGDGTFQSPQTVATPAAEASDLAVADINGDGNLDLIAAVGDNIEVFHGNGNGTFQAGVTYATTAYADTVATGNFFNDGRTDVAVGDHDGNVEIFKNVDGALVLTTTVNLVNDSSTNSIMTIARAGNISGNGDTGLGVLILGTATYSGPVYAIWNNGNGTFTPDKLTTYAAPLGLNVGNANGSGIDSILVNYYCDPSVPLGTSQDATCTGIDIYYGQGGQKLIQRTVVTDQPDLAEGPVWPADVNGDGIIDLVGSGYHHQLDENAGLMVWLGNADGTFQQTPEYFYSDTDNTGTLVPGDWARNGMVGFMFTWGSGTEAYVNASDRPACGTYTISPSVTVCQPVDQTYSPSPVTVDANSYDTTPVTAMQEYIDGTLEYSKDVKSFDTTFPVNLGSHLFVTKAWDADGTSFVADRTITVFNGTPYPTCAATPGTASICLPSGTASSSPVHILANGGTDAIPTAAQLYIDGDLVVNNQGYCFSNGYCQGGTSYVDTNQSLSSGSHNLVFKLWDTDGNVYQASKTVTVN
jgi:hypothetical protein